MRFPLLTLSDIHAAYLQKEVLRGVTLMIQTGEIVTLSGENGSGKSTILKVVAGLLRPSQGTVKYQEHDLNGLGVGARKRLGLSYLMQGGRVFPSLTVQENFDLSIAQSSNRGREYAHLGDWFPPLCGRRHDRAGLLSGGLRQMLAVELIFAQQPNLLLLDEPTGALTEELALLMLDRIKQYVENHTAAALIVEHMPAASDFATHCLHLTYGKITPLPRS